MTEIIETAKALKIDLRTQWPGVAWSVRTPPRSWFHVRVAWSDGPTSRWVEAWCRDWANAHPSRARWLAQLDTARSFTPVGWARVIEPIARDMPDLPIPRTADGGLDIRAGRALLWDKPIRVAGRFYGHPERVYDVVAVVEMVARDIDLTTTRPADESGAGA